MVVASYIVTKQQKQKFCVWKNSNTFIVVIGI